MQIRAHLIEKNGDISECTVEDALCGAKAGKSHYWIDIDADERDADELREWLRGLNIPHFLLDVLAEPPEMWASQVVPLQRAALAVIRILPEQLDSDEMSHLAALHLRNLLLTFTSCPRSDTGGLYAPALAQMKQRERLPAATSSGALLAWLRFHIERTSRNTRFLRYTVLACDEAMDRDVTSVKLDQIIAAKDQLLRLLSVAEEQTECLEGLAAVEADTEMLDFSPVRGSLSMLLATAGATERMALRLEKHIAELRQRHEGHEHEKMNRRLAVLTVFSVIFLPLTLFTGIWGMNFENMPELKAPDAYPMALLLMVTVALVMMCYFQRTGWFE
jgi:Mg2+ and Co2+ transporter CorA